MPAADRDQLLSLLQQMQANLEALMPGAADIAGAAAGRTRARSRAGAPRKQKVATRTSAAVAKA